MEKANMVSVSTDFIFLAGMAAGAIITLLICLAVSAAKDDHR